VRADVPRDPCGFRDSDDHAVDVAAVNWLSGRRPEDERSFGPLTSAGLQDAEHWHRDGHGSRLAALPDQVQDAVPAESLLVILDSHSRRLGRTEGVDAEQVGQRAVVHGQGLGNLEKPDQLEPANP